MGLWDFFLIIKGKYILNTLEDLRTLGSLASGLYITQISRREKESQEIIEACVLLCVFQSQRGNATVAASKNFLPSPTSDAFFWLNIRNIVMKCNLIHLLKINTEVFFS